MDHTDPAGLPGTDDLRVARERLAPFVRHTPLVPFESGDPRVELRLKLECRQATGAFKARGAMLHVLRFDPSSGAPGLVTCSSGNHGKALAWAGAERGVPVRVHMPQDAYPSKVAACRASGAEVVLAPDRVAAEEAMAASVAQGWCPAPPYDSSVTVAGQGGLALEVLDDWPEVDVLVAPVGGGGMLAGCAIAFAGAPRDGAPRRVLGVEPVGAASMHASLAAGAPVRLRRVDSLVQGLTPPGAGRVPFAVLSALAVRVDTIDDESVLRAQARLVRGLREPVEPAGAAATARVLAGLPEEWLAGREEPLRVAAVVCGANAHEEQLARLLAGDDPWLLPDGRRPGAAAP